MVQNDHHVYLLQGPGPRESERMLAVHYWPSIKTRRRLQAEGCVLARRCENEKTKELVEGLLEIDGEKAGHSLDSTQWPGAQRRTENLQVGVRDNGVAEVHPSYEVYRLQTM